VSEATLRGGSRLSPFPDRRPVPPISEAKGFSPRLPPVSWVWAGSRWSRPGDGGWARS